MDDPLQTPPPPPVAPQQPPAPEDIFSGVPDPAVHAAAPAESVPPMGQRAAQSGVMKKVLILAGGVLVLGIVAVVVYMVLVREPDAGTDLVAAPAPVAPESTTSAPAAVDVPSPETAAPAPSAPPTAPAMTPPEAPAVSAVDTDGDGLPDAEETRLGTDAAKPDTDNDGLSDREEARVYQTDPLKSDTDGDTFPDGKEVQNGYNPRGKGLLFEVPR
ncbi:hypothetical protein HYV74_00940 [Candidatus Uhrbacteria bacterium]|nr:hypothetical protein [Candidatus Uhrbacteria bacterium]